MSACVGSSGAPLVAMPATQMPRAVTLVLTVLMVSTGIALTALLYRSSLRIPFNYNEGWNAFWAHRAALGQAIYPLPDAMVFNNYPPLSFLLVGALSKFGIEVWIVGRIVSWLSFAGCAVLIGAVLRALGGDRSVTTLGAMLFSALMAIDFNGYLGMYDPQLTAHCGMLAGLYLLLRRGGPSHRSVILGALVMVASGFIKHNLIALPAAITVWLALYRRDLLATWLATAVAGLVVGFLLCWASFGSDFLIGLATPRVWDWRYADVKLLHWMPPIALPVLVALCPPPRPARDGFDVLLLLFVGIALVNGCLGLAGDGVVYNALFELVIAISLMIGRQLGRARLALVAATFVALSTSLTSAMTVAHGHTWATALDRLAVVADRSVARIAAQPGPALCEDLLVCYWAGKDFEVDIFNYMQAVRTGRRDAHRLQSEIEQGYFGAIEMDPKENRMPPDLRAVIAQRYDPVAGLPGMFLRRAAEPPHLVDVQQHRDATR